MAEELKIIIDADVSQAQAGLNQFADTVNNKVVKPLKDIPAAANAGLSATTQQAKVVTLAVSKLGSTIDALKQKVAGKQALISTERDVNNIIILNKEIQALEAEIVRVQNLGKVGFNEFGRAVSDSSDKIVAGFGNAFSAIRRLAFILPGIGIAGIFDAAFTGFQKLVSALQFSNFGVPRFKELINSIEGAKDEFVKASVAVETLKDEIQLAKDGFISKDEVVKKYNETIGKTTGIVKTLDEAETALNKNANAYIQFTLLKAAANVALGKSAEVAFQAALQNQKDLERISKITADKEGIGEFIKSGEENLRKAEQESFNKRVNSLKDIANNFLKEAGEIKKQFNFNFFDESKTDSAKKGLDEVQRKMIELAKAAEKVFDVPLKLRFDDTDLNETKLKKAKDVLQGIKDFTIKARVDIQLPDIKELPKEQVDKFFVNVPNALRDAINKGLIELPDDAKVLVNAEVGPFSKEIQDVIDQFNREGFKVPVTFDLKDADLLAELKTSFKGFQDAVNSIRKVSFSELINQLEIAGALGEEAGKQTEEAFLKAGKSAEEAAAAGKAIEDTYKGISKGAGDSARAVNELLTPAFQNLFDAILQGKDPLQAFFKSIIQGIEQLISKLIAAAVEAAILAAITGGTSSFGSLFGKLLGFAKGGEPPVDKPSIVGEKGWEIFVPKVPGTIISHEKSVQLLNRSVNASSIKEHESIKEYLITTKINQAIKEQFTNISQTIKEGIKVALVPVHTKLSETIKSIATTSEKLTAYSYKLHEVNNNNIQSLKESIVKTSESERHFREKSIIEKYFKEFKHDTSEKENNSSFEKITSDVRAVISSIDKSITTSFTSKIEKLIDKVSAQSKVINIERIINNNVSDKISSLKQMSFHDLEHKLHIPAFASGGAVFGPTLAILGEGFGISRSNPEFVGTASQLKGIQGGAFDVNVNVNGDISFDMGKLAVALNRESRSHFRTNGKKPF